MDGEGGDTAAEDHVSRTHTIRIYPGRPAAAVALRHAGFEPMVRAVHHFNGL
jgi:hypothetical protein